jgi:hypothetical protein
VRAVHSIDQTDDFRKQIKQITALDSMEEEATDFE